MFKTFLAVVVGMTLAQINGAGATSLDPRTGKIFESRLTHFQIDKNLAGASMMNDGIVTVNFRNQSVSVALYHKSTCLTCMRYPMMVIAPFIVNLPLVGMKTDGCGRISYTGRKDLRPVDGSLQEITIVDASQMKPSCSAKSADTMVLYQTLSVDRQHGKNITTRSSFLGLRLQESLHIAD